jgi:hypothetical protein
MCQACEPLQKLLERYARGYHEQRQVDNSREHKFWKFENCPSAHCKESREALGIRTHTLADFVPAKREPGQEG